MSHTLDSHRAGTRLILTLCFALTLACAPSKEPPTSDSSKEAQVAATPDRAPSTEAAIDRLRLGDNEGAIAILEKVIAEVPEDSRAWVLLGQCRLRLEHLEEALTAFEKALEIDPGHRGATYGAAAVAAQQGLTDEAVARLQKLAAGGDYDLTPIPLDPSFESLRTDPRLLALLPGPEDFDQPFVESHRALHEWRGEREGGEFGWIARNIGDVNGDGVPDLTTSAPSQPEGGANAGWIVVYDGKTGYPLWDLSGAPGDQLGRGIEAAGDVNGDGIPDVIAGSPGIDQAGVHSGKNGRLLRTFSGRQPGEFFGRNVSDAGDVNGDGYDDVLVGAPRFDLPGEGGDDAGRIALFSGKNGEPLAEWLGKAGDRLGSSVAGAATEAGPFLVFGAPDAGEEERGQVLVYRDLGQEPAFVIPSDDAGAELGGMFVSVVGDVNADGTPDIYASDWAHGALGPRTGRVVVHSGQDGGLLLTLTGETAGEGFGIGPADAGDVNGDGHDDLVVGAWQHSGGAPSGGKVTLFSGKDGEVLRTWTGQVMGDTFGFDATGMGDVDGDGTLDLLLTSAWSSAAGPRSGRMFLLSAGR